ncbi:hypothetical protein M408DRAFT_27881 [Serendipita vermifera MAFF 305830]|uniref:DUF6535 domain-containing protein n=1 Tax=Serendipita vermifera MAFF 305830 TaxID=933852 RepID=A0A0C2WAF4_SERVB|nr:hypothetical protein M408DRAFT_27881 [Serendipita vermifera MAFF 305830]
MPNHHSKERKAILGEYGPFIKDPDPEGSQQFLAKEYTAWDVYNNEARKLDIELIQDWRSSLNSLLLFAAIFAAVLTAFITESKKLLEQDPSGTMVDALIFHINNVANGTHTPFEKADFMPSSSDVIINCLLFASLSTSLSAALASVVALQWVADYDAAITRGGSSPEDRAKRRQFRYAGVIQWKMGDIIAALPILIYCSVLLFYAALMLWIWTVHHTVGMVIVGGAAFALLFYGASTFLAVVSVSAPFRTPLSRWIHSLFRLFLSAISFLAHSTHLRSIPRWLAGHHMTHSISRSRDDREVDKGDYLVVQSLVWLANRLSISQDSYNRLLLLVSELPKLESELLLTPCFPDAPWLDIFDLLGWANLNVDPNQEVSNQEMQAISILSQCYRVAVIRDMVTPKDPAIYLTDDSKSEYWSQYCDVNRGPWSTRPRGKVPNSLFLLFRDIPMPSKHTSYELEFTIRISRWRNSLQSTPQNSLTLVDPSVATEQNYFGLSNYQDNNRYVSILHPLAQMYTSSEGRISPPFLDSLRQRFESIILGTENVVDAMPCLYAPVRYMRALQSLYRTGSHADQRLPALHHSFTLLLARNLDSFTGEARVRRVKEVLMMVWMYLSDDIPDVNGREKEMEGFFDDHVQLIMNWIKLPYEVPNIREILCHLAAAAEDQPEIGSLWRITSPTLHDDSHLLEALTSFDDLISEGVTTEQHYTLIDLVCRDLKLGPPEMFTNYFNRRRLEAVSDLDSLCFKVLAYAVAGHDTGDLELSSDEIMGPWRKSWGRMATYLFQTYELTDSQSMLRLQASMWCVVPHQSNLCTRALQDYKTLEFLRDIFYYSVSCPQHYDGEGHLLLHIFGQLHDCKSFVDTEIFTEIPSDECLFNVLSLILISPDEPSQPPPLLRDDVNANCWSRLSEECRVVKTSQFAFLTLVSDLIVLVRGDEREILAAEDVELMTTCVAKAFLLPPDHRILPTLPLLILRLQELRDGMVDKDHRSSEENTIAVSKANATIGKIATHLVTNTIYGKQNIRILSCARTCQGYSPAGGWLPLQID